MKNILITIASSIFLLSCGAGQGSLPENQNESIAFEGKNYFVTAPQTDALAKMNMQAQTAGALAVLRNQTLADGISLANCGLIKAFLATDLNEFADMEGFSAAYSRVFGTKLVPNQPQLLQIQVVGFANPQQLVLLEANCTLPK
ncbi:hypothetical protein MNBD_ALPHA06-1894 [hydrothermal vent metagenome]|uniref:Uncharacterized protein n=1 Tax=hydrothermal vent metagenome TaxID=652676 RepID=A0A3B0SHW3_9ZZZZ